MFVGVNFACDSVFRAKVNILMFLESSFPPDIRVEKESSSLLRAGYNVILLTPRKKGHPDFEVLDGVYVLRVKWPYRIRTFSYPLDILRLFAKSLSFALKYDVRILHVHDLPYALFVVLLGKLLRRKVVFDMHEHYVGMSEPVLRRRRIGRLLIFYLRLKEMVSCKLATKIITVIEENARRVIGLGVPTDKVAVVSNTVDTDLLDGLGRELAGGEFRGKFIISYVGGFSFHRGLDTLLKALPIVVKRNPNVHLLLVGKGEMEDMLQELAEDLGVRDYVTFTGWVSLDEAMGYVRLSDLGVIPYHSTPHTNCTVPHKIFQYMYFEKPVLVSDVKPLKRIVEETGCGIVFPAGDYVQLAEKILEVIGRRDVLRKMGKNGRKAVVEKYNWKVEGAKLVKLYHDLTNRL